MRGFIASFLVLTLLLGSGAIPTVAAMQSQSTPVAAGSPVPALPEPMTLPSGNPDDQAATLARYVLAGGETAMPALLAALQASGITVLHLAGGVAVPGAVGAGSSAYVFLDWEVLSLLDLERSGFSTTLPDLGAALAVIHPEMNDAPIASMLLDGMRTSAESDDPSLRFWARFVVALGKYGSSSYDLLGDFDQSTSLLDAVQLSLLLNRVVSDVVTTNPDVRSGAVGNRLAFAQGSPSKAPCQLSDVEGRILSYTGIAGSVGFGQFVRWLQRVGSIAEDTADAIKVVGGLVNSVAGVLQVILAWVGFSPEMHIEAPGPPLVRTKNRTPGEQRVVRLQVNYDVGNWQFLNCIRPLLQSVGLDLSEALSRNGPVEGAEVAWSIPKGSSANINDPETRIIEPIIEYHSGDILHTVTDKDGVVRVTVEGVAQHDTLPESSVAVPKEVRLRAAVALKPENLLDDATTVISNMLCGGSGAAVACAIPEMLLRSHFLFSAGISFQVIDWELPGGFHITHHVRVVSSTKGVGLDITWESTLKPKEGAPDLSDMTGEGTYYGTVMVYPANGLLCQDSAGEAVELGGTVEAMGSRSAGYVIYELEGTRTLGKIDGNVLGVPPDIAVIGAEPVDLGIGSKTAEHTTVITAGDECYGTVTQTESISITTIPYEPAP